MPDKQINKILIIRLSSLGDILLSTPVIRSIKRKFSASQIDFVVKKQFKDALLYNPNISNLIIYEKENAKQLKNNLKIGKYDLVIDLQNNFRSNNLTSGIRVQIRRFKKPSMRKLLLVWFKINFLKNIKTISERYAETAGVDIDNNELELFFPQDIKTELNDDKNYIGLCPGSKHFTKRWPSEYFIELGNKLAEQGFIIVLLGGKDDKELCETISAKIEGSINLQNEDLLLQTAAEMKHCKVIITNDSGLMHAASAVGITLISIFGSTVREFGFMPTGQQNLILENKLLSCRPCSHIGRSSCPKKHFKCMKEITPEFVLSQINNIQVGI
ncbi:MAG: glycosyltransferase family 9 protein [Ignavibacteriales bacterium]|nr:glycosyltransferase family 9 protein [Ignavibacteriales bacterium]